MSGIGCLENLRAADCLSIVKVNSEPTANFVRVTPTCSEITKKFCPFRSTIVLSSDNCDAWEPLHSMPLLFNLTIPCSAKAVFAIRNSCHGSMSISRLWLDDQSMLMPQLIISASLGLFQARGFWRSIVSSPSGAYHLFGQPLQQRWMWVILINILDVSDHDTDDDTVLLAINHRKPLSPIITFLVKLAQERPGELQSPTSWPSEHAIHRKCRNHPNQVSSSHRPQPWTVQRFPARKGETCWSIFECLQSPPKSIAPSEFNRVKAEGALRPKAHRM